MIKILAMLSVLLMAMPIMAQSNHVLMPYFEHIGLEQGLSHLVVRDMVQDSQGFIWFATDDGLNRYDGYNMLTYRTDERNRLSHYAFRRLLLDPKGLLWIGSEQGLNVFDPQTGEFNDHRQWQPLLATFANTRIIAMTFDQYGDIWLGTQGQGLARIDSKTLAVSRYFHRPTHVDSLLSDQVFALTAYQDQLFVGTSKGLNQIDLVTKRIISTTRQDLNAQLTDLRIEALLVDSNHDLWIGTTNGLNRYQFSSQKLSQYFKATGVNKVFTANTILSLFEADDGRVWIGSQGGVHIYQPKTGEFSLIRHQGDRPSALSSNSVTSIMADRGGVMWLGTANGVNKLSKAALYTQHFAFNALTIRANDKCIQTQNKTTSMLHRNKLWLGSSDKGLFKIDLDELNCESFSQGLTSHSILSLYANSADHIWVGTDNQGLNQITVSTNTVQQLSISEQSSPFITGVGAIAADSAGHLWLASRAGGLLHLDVQDRVLTDVHTTGSVYDKKIAALAVDSQDKLWLVQNSGVIDIVTTKGVLIHTISASQLQLKPSFTPIKSMVEAAQFMWFAVDGCGLVAIDKIDFTVTPYCDFQTQRLSSINHVQLSKAGFLWLSTDRGLARFDISMSKYRYFTAADGIPNQRYFSTLENQAGQLLAIHGKGIVLMEPQKVASEAYAIPTAITGYRIFNQKPQSIDNNKIAISYQDKMLSIMFTALEYSNPQGIEFAYRLTHLNQQWLLTDAQHRVASFTNMEPGQYHFEVKARAKGGDWLYQPSRVVVEVVPPWWLTIGFKLLLTVLVLLLVLGSYYYRMASIRRKNVALAREVDKRTQQLAQEKALVEQLLDKREQDIANISHEFRTPLTLILGPIQQLLDKHLMADIKYKLQLVQRNSQRLLRMVEQLLSLESHQYKQEKTLVEVAVSQVIEAIVVSFKVMADAKNITLSLELQPNIAIKMSADGLDKIVNNLISNAIKYTPDNGKVVVKASIVCGDLVIVVKDNGIGIAPEHHFAIFKRFVRLGGESQSGAGIGLALVETIVNTHGGSIELQSQVQQGTEISVRLPAAYIVNKVIEPTIASLPKEWVDIEFNITERAARSDLMTILVIEDNGELRQFLFDILSLHYHCITAFHGEHGVALALEHLPDVIVSDIMMPKVDGYEVCHQIRANPLTSHIPIMLLTAKHDKPSRIKGWQQHIDDYMTKPFDHQELLMRIDSILAIRKLVQTHHQHEYQKQMGLDKVASFVAASTQDRPDSSAQLVERINDYITSRISDNELKVADIARHVGMQEKLLNKKLKALLNVTVNEYVRQRRLLFANHLIKQGEPPSSVYLSVGFSSHTYFSRCYKALFNVTPSQTQ